MALSYQKRREQNRRGWFDLPKRFFAAALTPRVRGTLRVLAYLSVVTLVALALSVRSAWGSVTEQALVTGRQLAKLSDLTKESERLLLNGQALQISSAVTDKSLDEVLERFDALCREDGVVARDFREVKGLLSDNTLTTAAKKNNFGVLKERGKDDGVVACTVRDPKNGDRPFWDGLAKFAETWDLADVGHVRYVYARRLESGDTHVITVWTDASFKLDAMIPPADGSDAPGNDSATFPRPEASQRYLSAGAEGRPHGVRIYESKAMANDVLGNYEKTLPGKGWEQVSIGEDAPEARYFTKGGVDVIVMAQQNGDRAVVSIMETRGF